MRTSVRLVIVLFLCGVVPIVGCGSGGGGSPSGEQGSLSVSVVFPPRGEGVAPELLPVATNSVRIQMLTPGTLTPILPDQVVARSGGGTQTAVFDMVPIGPCLVRALAYESDDGTGRVIARAEVVATVVAGELTEVTLITEALVVRVHVAPATLNVEKTTAVLITATCYDADDNVVITAVKWQSDSANATVSTDGKVTGVNEGAARVKATHEATGASDNCDVTVFRRRTARVEVSPGNYLLRPPDHFSVQLTARAYDALNVVVPYAVITWSSDGEPVVTVDQDGLVSTTSADNVNATITASAGEGVDGTCAIRVAPVGKLGVEIR